MTVVAIVQARMTSSRLPGKVLMDLAGKPMLERVVRRAAAARRVDAVWVACTTGPADDPIARWCEVNAVPVLRGSESDVLGRFVATAAASGAATIVRLTADCPLLDPDVIDRTIAALDDPAGSYDYAANVLDRSYPRGLDTEVFTREALERMDALGSSAAAREHVTIPVRLESPAAFRVRSVRAADDASDLRWTVDTADDLAFVRRVYEALGLGDRIGSYQEVVAWCRADEAQMRRDQAGHTWDPSRIVAESVAERTES
ncbi:MAG: cytidylyltransferase domain-containing protein [Gemmatimonadales bacterium]